MCDSITGLFNAVWAKTIGGIIMWFTEYKNKRKEGRNLDSEFAESQLRLANLKNQDLKSQVKNIMLKIIKEIQESRPKSYTKITTMVDPKFWFFRIKVERLLLN